MICNKCGNENAESAKFCRLCGNALSASETQEPENESAPIAEYADNGSNDNAPVQGMSAVGSFGSLEAAPKLTVKKNFEIENAARSRLAENSGGLMPDTSVALPPEAPAQNDGMGYVQGQQYDTYQQQPEAYQQQPEAYQQQDNYQTQPEAVQDQSANAETGMLSPEYVQQNMQGFEDEKTGVIDPAEMNAVYAQNNAKNQNYGGEQVQNSFTAQNQYSSNMGSGYAYSTPVYPGIGEAVKKSSKSVFSLLTCILFTGAFVLYIIGNIDAFMLYINNAASMWVNIVSFSFITFTGFLAFLGMWISFFGSLGKSRPRSFGISLISFSNIIAITAFTAYLLVAVFTAIFSVISFGAAYVEGGLLNIVILALVLIFNIVFCSRIISNCSKARSAVKTGTVDGKASVLLPILCFAVGIISIGCAVFSIISNIYSNSYLLLNTLLIEIAIILFGLSCLFSGMNSIIFRINLEKAKY